VVCWGDDYYKQSTVPTTGTFMQVSAGDSHTCAISTKGGLACWGLNTDGQTSAPAGIYKQINAGTYHTCAVRNDGKVLCWGMNSFGQLNVPDDTYVQVSAGQFHSCGLKSNGTLTCWGRNADGQATIPTGGGTYTAVAAGGRFSCAVKTDGKPICWGFNADGQTTPPAGTWFRFNQVSAGGSHTCMVKSEGSVICWGLNDEGQLTMPDGAFLQVSAGEQHTCAVKVGGSLACWGYDGNDEASPPNGTFLQVSSGLYHSCGLGSDGSLDCWGNNTYSQTASPGGNYLQVSSGGYHSCSIRSDGALVCWGRNNYGQTTVPDSVVVYAQVSAGKYHTCAVKSNGLAVCWGKNDFSQASAPAGIFTQISAGEDHSCGLKGDGTVVCWGKNDYGQSDAPLDTFAQISAGATHTCGVKSNGAISCWGNNASGQSTPDLVRPSVIVKKAATQRNPTNAAPVVFAVTFSEAVTGFTPSDVTLSGTANPQATAVTGSGASYRVSVYGMTNSGTVQVIIPANVAKDVSGNLNTAAPITTNTVVYDITPPNTTITAKPPVFTLAKSATFSFSSSEGGTFQCSLDNGAFTTCVSPTTLTSLSPKTHTLVVRAQDKAGNVDPTPATYTWTVAAGLTKNGSFESSITGTWICAHCNSMVDKRVMVAVDGTYSWKFSPISTGASPKSLTQTIIHSGTAKDLFYLTLQSKAQDVPTTGGAYQAIVTFLNGSTVIGSNSFDITPGTHTWEKMTKSFNAPGNYTKIQVRFLYSKTAGTAWYDSVYLLYTVTP
jgi:alpha-tubulin suppressor-like RCC1 family protein